jgi:hypothetical protein
MDAISPGSVLQILIGKACDTDDTSLIDKTLLLAREDGNDGLDRFLAAATLYAIAHDSVLILTYLLEHCGALVPTSSQIMHAT